MDPMTHSASHLPDPNLDAQFYEGVMIKRLVAWGIDVAVVLILTLGAIVASLGLLAFVFPFLIFVINLAYRIFTIQNKSATIGMRLTGIELRNAKGDRFSLTEAVIHTGLFILIFISFLGILANMLAMFLNDRGQGLHDMLLGSAAINRPAD